MHIIIILIAGIAWIATLYTDTLDSILYFFLLIGGPIVIFLLATFLVAGIATVDFLILPNWTALLRIVAIASLLLGLSMGIAEAVGVHYRGTITISNVITTLICIAVCVLLPFILQKNWIYINYALPSLLLILFLLYGSLIYCLYVSLDRPFEFRDRELTAEETSLHNAAETNDTETLAQLIKKGVNVNATKGQYSLSALETAIMHGNTEAVKLLVKNGANVNPRSKLKRKIENILFTVGSNTKQTWKGPTHTTPLEIAIINRRTEIIKFLIENGADPTEYNLFGKNAFDTAKGHPEIEELLKQASTKK